MPYTHMVSPPQMPVPLKHMYNANIPRSEITTFVPSCPPFVTPHNKASAVLFQKLLRKWYANLLRFELRSNVEKMGSFAQISRNILAAIPRKDTNPSHPKCPSENLT